MADPLSLTLAAVTLATALKDIVELAQMIQESCEKVSRNRRELHSLASEVKTTVLQLKQFGDDYYDVLCDAEDMKVSFLGLITDMRVIHDRCRKLFPPASPRKMEKFKVAFNIWMNRNRMEEDIKDLRNRVNKCHSQFMMFGVMRIETHLVVIRQQNKVDHRQNRQITAIGASNDDLIAFVGSNSGRASLKLPVGITADFIADTYICLQIDTIDQMLNQLSSNSYPEEDPLEQFLLPFQPITRLASVYDKYTIQQELVCQLLQIQCSLRSDSGSLSIQTGALAMIGIGSRLHALKLYKEGHTTIKWTVDIFRSLAKTNSKIYLPYLVANLRNLSVSYAKVDDINGSFSAIEEAVEISRCLQASTTSIEMEFQLAHVLAMLSFVSGAMNNKEGSLKAAQESLEIYNNAIKKSHERRSYGFPVHPFNSQWISFFEGIPHAIIINYGWALDRLSSSFQAFGRLQDAFNTAKQALDVMAFCTNSFIDDASEIEIADILLRISHSSFHEFSSLEEALSFSERAVALFRVHCVNDVEENGISLCEALCQQADILEKMERHVEALAVCQQTVDLANDIIADPLTRAEALSDLSWTFRRLKRHDEAVVIRTKYVTMYSEYTNSKAQGYFDLGVELHLAGRWPEAIRALQAALTQYRALAFKYPEIYSKNIGRTLNQLIHSSICCKEFDQAFNDGHESLKLHQSLLENDPSVLNEYILAVRLNCLAAEVADNEDKCVERARYITTCARNIASKHPLEGSPLLSETIRRFAFLLRHFNRLSEAEIVIQEALEWHEQNLPQDEKDVEQHMRCLIATDVIVYSQGYFRKGAQYIQKSIDAGKPHSSHKSISSAHVQSMYRRVQGLHVSGLYREAAEAGKECVAFARQNAKEGIVDFIDCLQVAAIAFRSDDKLDEAIVHIQEALELSCSAEIIKLSDTLPFVLLLEVQSLVSLSGILANAGHEVQALEEGKLAVEKALGLKSKYASLPWSYIELFYIDALENYSLHLAASDDLLGSLDKLIQVRSYYESRIDSRLGDSLNLARVLFTEGIICCAAGRPDDGAIAVAGLHNLQKRLRNVLPELSQNLEDYLQRQRAFPSMAALIKQLKMTCHHEH